MENLKETHCFTHTHKPSEQNLQGDRLLCQCHCDKSISPAMCCHCVNHNSAACIGGKRGNSEAADEKHWNTVMEWQGGHGRSQPILHLSQVFDSDIDKGIQNVQCCWPTLMMKETGPRPRGGPAKQLAQTQTHHHIPSQRAQPRRASLEFVQAL